MSESTLPPPLSELPRVSAFRRQFRGESEAANGSERLTSLSPSLTQDLMRFERSADDGLEVLEVLAAAMRHARPLLMHLKFGAKVLPLSVFPVERQVHCPLAPEALLRLSLSALRVLHVQPAMLRPLGERASAHVGAPALYWALGPLLWGLALHGSRSGLLPEIAGTAAYRIMPSADLSALDVSPTMAQALARLRLDGSNLRSIAAWPGFNETLATRMLNGLYLQSALIVSRTHPAATNDGWRGAS